MLEHIKKLIREHSGVLAERYGVTIVGIFGSYVRGEQSADTDLDLLADTLRPISLLELVGAENYLCEILDAKVDLVLKRSVREELREVILDQAVALGAPGCMP
jgi:hypothetical protein